MALLELSGWAFLLGPVGIDEGETMSDRLELLLGGARFLQGMGLRPKGAVLSGGRIGGSGAWCERVDWCLLVDIYSLSTGLKKMLDGVVYQAKYDFVGDLIVY